MADYIRVSRLVAEVLSPMTYCQCYTGEEPPPPSTECCNTIRVNMTATATLGVRLTNIPRPRVQFNARAVTMGRLTNA